jgi:hypothetical protein
VAINTPGGNLSLKIKSRAQFVSKTNLEKKSFDEMSFHFSWLNFTKITPQNFACASFSGEGHLIK